MSVDRVFIDTNILVYPYDLKAGQKNTRARDLLRQTPRALTYVPAQVLREACSTLTRRFRYDLAAAASIPLTLGR